jgi:hypothetical protein
MKSTLFVAALFAAATASAQSSLTLPNNSAGTALDTPPLLPAVPDVMVPAMPRSGAPRDGMSRKDAEELAGPNAAEQADRNRDGRIDTKELPKLDDAPAPVK